MKPFVLSKALGVSIISLLVLMPLGLSASAQNSTSSGSSTTTSGSSSTTSGSSATTNTSSTQGAAPTSEDQDWGWIGLAGLLGLAGFLRRPARASVVGETPGDRLQTGIDATGDRLHQGVNQAQVGTRNLIEQVKTGVSEFKERRSQEKEIKDIKNALGRPSNRVILDRQDRVILNVGDLITNQAIERARAADMLDVLLDSVDEESAPIMDEERSAPIPGEAALDSRENPNRHQH